MNNDYLLVAGIIVGFLAFPTLLNAYSSSRSPRGALALFVAGSLMVGWVLVRQPNTYTVAGMPDVFLRVIASFIR